MAIERIGRRIRRREHLDVEALQQCPRSELDGRQSLGDVVIRFLCRLGIQRVLDPEHFAQLVLYPGSCRCRPEESPVIGKCLPDLSRIRFGRRRRGIECSDAKRLHWNPPGVKQPQDVMVRGDEERRGIRECIVGCEQPRVDVPVWRDDRQRARLIIDVARVPANCRIGIEVSILVELGHTTGFQRGSYSRDQSRAACGSLRMCPFLGSVVSLRPTCCEMVPRWQSVPVFAPSSIGAESLLPVRTASTKLSMWSWVSQSSPRVLRLSLFGAACTCLTILLLRS